MRFFDTEIVFRGHHDKLADQLSDAVMQHYLKINPKANVNIDIVGGEDTIFITGNVMNVDKVDVTQPIRTILEDLGYDSNMLIVDDSCQGKHSNHKPIKATSVYGYATNETEIMLPKTMLILQDIAKEYEKLRKVNPVFLPDGKVIMQGAYENGKLVKIKSININHQNTGNNEDLITGEIYGILAKVSKKYNVEIEDYVINPYGPYYKGGFNRDTGLTGSKLSIDNYQKFTDNTDIGLSGKSIYGIRAGVYKARALAKEILSQEKCQWCEVKVDYLENSATPHNITIETDIGEIEPPTDILSQFEPINIIQELNLLNKDYVNLSAYGQIQE